MPPEPGPSLRLVSRAPSERPVLTGRPGRLRGEVLLHNDGPEPVALPQAELRAEVGRAPAAIRLQTARPLPLDPAVASPVSLTASLDPRTPPGTYDGEVVVGGVAVPVQLVVNPDIALTLSESELVVIAGRPGERSLTMHNLGNVPLDVSQIGPAELEVDTARPRLLQRIGLLPASGEPARPVQPVRRWRKEGDDCEAEPVPTVTARLPAPLVVAPGDTVTATWVVTTDGPLEPGVRYRATAPLYTTDIGFVVAPAQDAPAPPPPPAPAPAPRVKPTQEKTAQSQTRRAPRKRKESS